MSPTIVHCFGLVSYYNEPPLMSRCKGKPTKNNQEISGQKEFFGGQDRRRIHPGKLTWNIIMEVWKIIFLSKWVIYMFHVNLPGCNNKIAKGADPRNTRFFPQTKTDGTTYHHRRLTTTRTMIHGKTYHQRLRTTRCRWTEEAASIVLSLLNIQVFELNGCGWFEPCYHQPKDDLGEPLLLFHCR